MASTTFATEIENLIGEAIRRRTQKIAEEELNATVRNITNRVKSEIDSIALSILKYYRVESMADHIIITVKKKI
jgi:hypothetical protein